MKRILHFTLPVILLILPCLVQAVEKPKVGTLSFVVENDLFYNVDRHYTSGVRMVWVPGLETPPPEWAVAMINHVPWIPEEGDIRHGYSVGQSMFTPSDITVANPSVNDRPYAGWLNGTIGLGVESGKQLHQFGLTIGVIGPVSLAEQSQKYVHKMIDSDQPKGWDEQLDNEPGFVLTYLYSWRSLASTTFSGNKLDLTPHTGGALGNVFTYCNVGMTIRYGEQLPLDYGPPRIQPGLPGSGDFSPVSEFNWYLFVGFEVRAVAHNIFLDGNTFSDSHSVAKEPVVGDFQFGIVLDWSRIRLSYTHVMRTREFETQEENDDFGAISLSVKF